MKKEFYGYCDEFLSYLINIRGYSNETVTTYQIAIKQMIEFATIIEENGTITIEITPLRIKIVKNSKKTIAKKLSAIRSFVKFLEKHKNMTIILRPNESIKVPQTLPKPIDESYIQEAINNSTLEEKTIIYCLYGLGLRISELSNMKIENTNDGWVQIRGKGNKVRELPIALELAAVLKEYIDMYNPKIYLFENNNIQMSAPQLRYKVGKIFAAHGIRATPHQLRHSFATHLLNNGARISDVSELLGHSTMATTQIYTRLGSSKKLSEYMNAHPLAKR
jgi:integrase/recombinase XerC